MLRQIIIEHFYKSDIQEPLPFNWENDYEQLAKYLVKHFNKERLRAPEVQNKTTKYTSEYTFQSECFAILRSALKVETSFWYIFVEAKNVFSSNNRADLLLRNGKKMLIELKAAGYFVLSMVLFF